LPSTLQLQSSSTLGSGRTLTAQERLEKAEDKEVSRAIYSRQTSGRFADIAESDEGEEVLDSAQDVHSVRDMIQDGEGTSPRGPVVIVNSTSTTTRKQDLRGDVVVGSALQRNADGSIVKPRIMKKKGTAVRLVSPLSWYNSHSCCIVLYQDHLAKVETYPTHGTTNRHRC
jgi:ATP-dependent RNA helicase DHX37/DHR1